MEEYTRPKYVYPPDASIALTAPHKQFYSPQAHSKHRGFERPVAQQHVQHLMSDRDPDLVAERQSRMRAHADALASDPSVFKGKKTADSFATYVVEAQTLHDLLGSTRQVRDEESLHPPAVPYSYSRIPRPSANPPAYDYDDSWHLPRTRGYSPGHVRSLSPPPPPKTPPPPPPPFFSPFGF
mmetsp:Transcript_8106/g.16209  ORF Transcript_8106/g.16209 Transcript_8106/m.16209 type:complete len:182 (+) Transcript_8106:193-738(+)